MKKRTIYFLFLLLIGFAKLTSAQNSENSIQIASRLEKASPKFIDEISFTPNGILTKTESGGTKAIKEADAPVIVRSNAVENKSGDASPSVIETLSGVQFKYAMLLDVDVESLKDLSLFGCIDNWFGTRYRMGGTTKRGIDCSALTSSLILAAYRFTLPRTARQQYQATDHISKGDLREGDLVFFNIHGGVSHVGIYLENDYFVHASSRQGVTISSLDDNYYSKRFICGGRVMP
jgi:lipoprotein Spr